MTTKIVEILQYELKKGSGEAFHQIMRDISIPLHIRHGIDVIAYGNSLHDTDNYYLMRAFASEQQMRSILEAFYSSDGWRAGPREDIISNINVSLKSILSLPQSAVDELRVTSSERK